MTAADRAALRQLARDAAHCGEPSMLKGTVIFWSAVACWAVVFTLAAVWAQPTMVAM